MLPAHAHNEAARAAGVVDRLAGGHDVAIVSDAGTPLVSDPGERIVRAAVAAGHSVVPIPGPSAVLAALVGSGLEAGTFTFLGFVPRKGAERADVLEQISEGRHTSIVFEAPGRLATLLEELVETCGADRQAVVARELTKLHEEFARGSLSELQQRFSGEAPRGEIVVVVARASGSAEGEMDSAVEETAALLGERLSARGWPARDIARELQARLKIPRNVAYALAQRVKNAGDG